MTDEPISLATERKARERDFAQERADLLKELQDIGVEEPELVATVQHVMLVEWSVFHAARMLEYQDIDRSPEALAVLARWRRLILVL